MKIKILSVLLLFVLAVINLSADEKKVIKTISAIEGYKLIESSKENKDFFIIDVRTPAEFNEVHIEKSLNIDFNDKDFEKNISKLDKNKSYAIYCRSGNRSEQALKVMEKLGFKTVYNFGGIIDWLRAGFKTVK